MKQYIINSLQRVQNHSKQMDAESILWYKKWWIFNDEGEAEVMIFRPGNELLVSRNGVVTKGKWELNIDDSTLLMEFPTITYLFQPLFIDDNLFSLRPYGMENNFVVMIDEANKDNFKPKTLDELNQYFDDKKIESILMGEEEARKQWDKKKEEIKSHIQLKRIKKLGKRIVFALFAFFVSIVVVVVVAAFTELDGFAMIIAIVAVVVLVVSFGLVLVWSSKEEKLTMQLVNKNLNSKP